MNIKSILDKTLRQIHDWLRSKTSKIILPGFDKIPLYDVLVFFIKGLFEGDLTMRASAVAFNFFLAIFPSILFFFTLIPYFPIDDFQQNLFILMAEVIPEKTFQTVQKTLEDILTNPNSGLLSLGFFFAMIFSTSGISTLIAGFNSSIHISESRSMLYQRLIALLLVFILSLLVVIGSVLLNFGTYTLKFLIENQYISSGINYELIQAAKWIVIVMLFFLSVSFLYYLAPAKRNIFKFISAGSTLATILLLLTSIGFNYYANQFSRYNALYGSIGTLILFLAWLHLNVLILLIGYDLNASIYRARQEKNQDILASKKAMSK